MKPSPASDSFWPRVRLYREMGLDPLKWIAGCSIELDQEEVVQPAISGARDELARLGVTVHPRDGPDILEWRGEPPAPTRALVRPGQAPQAPRTSKRGNPRRAVVAMRVFQRRADDPQGFGAALTDAFARLPGGDLDNPISVGRLHAVATPQEAAEFSLFEFYEEGKGAPRGYAMVDCDTLQVADATLEPLAEEHAAAVVTAALSRPLALGATKDLALFPIFDAPNRKASDTIAANFYAVAAREGLKLHERAAVGTGKLLVGAAVSATTDREVPNKHHYVKRGMQVTVTRPFGELAPLATYLSCLSDADYLTKLEAAGIGLPELSQARGDTVRALTSPPHAAGRVIHDFCPPFQEPPELANHLAATFGLGGRGVFALLDFARRFEVEVELRALPLSHPAISRLATSAYLMDNATATGPGAIAIVAWPSVLEQVDRALAEAGEKPTRVGEVVARGSAAVRVPTSTREAVASKQMLRGLAVEGPQAA